MKYTIVLLSWFVYLMSFTFEINNLKFINNSLYQQYHDWFLIHFKSSTDANLDYDCFTAKPNRFNSEVVKLWKLEGRYEVVSDFPNLPENIELGSVAGVAINSKGQIVVTHRGDSPILMLDRKGSLIRAFGDELLTAVHGTRIDEEDNIWVTDMSNHTVIKFSPEGEVLLKLGKRGEPGDSTEQFNRPTDIAFDENGDVFVSDGYGNSRIIKFNSQGEYITQWGEPGDKQGQFDLPHGVQVDAEGYVHVADRENDRIQVFTTDGSYVREYGGFAPFGIHLLADGRVFVADGRAHEVIIMTLEGERLTAWGNEGERSGEFQLPHGIAVDEEGAVYVTEIEGRRIQKFVQQK